MTVVNHLAQITLAIDEFDVPLAVKITAQAQISRADGPLSGMLGYNGYKLSDLNDDDAAAYLVGYVLRYPAMIHAARRPGDHALRWKALLRIAADDIAKCREYNQQLQHDDTPTFD